MEIDRTNLGENARTGIIITMVKTARKENSSFGEFGAIVATLTLEKYTDKNLRRVFFNMLERSELLRREVLVSEHVEDLLRIESNEGRTAKQIIKDKILQ